jgi:predicted nucleic acid-binding protein
MTTVHEAELDYLVATRHGVDAELAVLDELTGGAWELAGFGVHELARARSIIAKYRGQEIGVAGASNVVLAERHRTRTIVTLDRRHFDVLRPITGGSVHFATGRRVAEGFDRQHRSDWDLGHKAPLINELYTVA